MTWRGGSRFVLTGEVNLDPSAELDVSTPNDMVEINLARRSTPEHAVAMLRRALPRSISMRHEQLEDGVEVIFQEALVPAAKTPRFRIFSTDAVLRLKQLDENKIEFQGGVGEDCLLTVLCDSRRVTLSIPGGSSALAIAARVGSNVPHGFRALVDGPVVSVWKDADFFSAVA
ncbi:MAG: hypothetical protein Q8L48_02285 [Archangium sp.]|nr:hypothetical protein [Archangium sp.]